MDGCSTVVLYVGWMGLDGIGWDWVTFRFEPVYRRPKAPRTSRALGSSGREDPSFVQIINWERERGGEFSVCVRTKSQSTPPVWKVQISFRKNPENYFTSSAESRLMILTTSDKDQDMCFVKCVKAQTITTLSLWYWRWIAQGIE